MPENERVTVRRLPGGETREAILRGLKEDLLQVELTAAAAADLGMGALVEVQSPGALYFGEIQGREGSELLISVEHVLTRSALADVQSVWRPTGGSS